MTEEKIKHSEKEMHKEEHKNNSKSMELKDGLRKSTAKGLEDGLKKESEEDIKKAEEKTDKKEQKKEETKVKKDKAFARGANMPISKKHSIFICRFIKGKSIDEAIKILQEVVKMRRAVPFTGEIPHRKGMMSGRYPVNAAKEFIILLKGLKGNASVNGLDLEKTRIELASATWGRRPLRRGSRKAKRTEVLLIARELNSEVKK